jgi:putative transposase
VIPACPHHVTQRGNNRQDVFFVDADRQAYLTYLHDAAGRFDLRVEGYCLMTNHVHLVVEPVEETSLAHALKRTNQLYAQYVNRLHRRSGHLWQDRFYSCPLDYAHFWRALAYVERNPVRAHLCERAWQWRWSRAAAHCGADDPSGLLDMAAWHRDMDTARWRQILDRSDVDRLLPRLRLATSRGRPLGSDAFIAKLANPPRPPPPTATPRPAEKAILRRRSHDQDYYTIATPQRLQYHDMPGPYGFNRVRPR